jgi:hypothetical protein
MLGSVDIPLRRTVEDYLMVEVLDGAKVSSLSYASALGWAASRSGPYRRCQWQARR